jgi:hypothetical protein
MKGVGGKDGGMPVGGREPAELGLDLVRPDPRRLENGGVLRQLGDRRGRGGAHGAALAIERDALDPRTTKEKRDADQVSAWSATRRSAEGSHGYGATTTVVGQIALKEIAIALGH